MTARSAQDHRWQNGRVHADEDRQRLRQTFDRAAGRYDRVRPDYPEALFDRLAGLTRDPDAAFAELRAAYGSDARLRVPATVYNAVLNRPEPVLP